MAFGRSGMPSELNLSDIKLRWFGPRGQHMSYGFYLGLVRVIMPSWGNHMRVESRCGGCHKLITWLISDLFQLRLRLRRSVLSRWCSDVRGSSKRDLQRKSPISCLAPGMLKTSFGDLRSFEPESGVKVVFNLPYCSLKHSRG